MSIQANTKASGQALSLVHGLPLKDEPGIGALTLGGYLQEVCQRFADREALVFYSHAGKQRWTYNQLWEQSCTVARALIANGLNKNARVGILMTNRPEFLSSLFGVALAGGVSVVLSTFSTAHELEYLLKSSDVSTLLFDQHVLKTDFEAILTALEPALLTASPGKILSTKFPFLQQLVALGSVTTNDTNEHTINTQCITHWNDFLAKGQACPPEMINARSNSVDATDTAGIFYSSGTTNLPKGILHTHRAFALQWWRYPRLLGIDEAIRGWTANGLFWSGNIAMTLGATLSNGGTMLLQPVFEAKSALEMIEKEKANFLYGRPHQWARLKESPLWKSANLSQLRYIPRGEMLWDQPTINTQWVIPMGYGTTETMSICTSNVFNRDKEEIPGCFGSPLPGNLLKIVDPHTGDTLPTGESGEIRIKGPILMTGYIGKTPEQSFDEAGYFATGDGGYVDDEGHLFFEGRLTQIIKTGGANVSPVEIDTLLGKYPGVRRSETIGLPHDTLGEIVVSCVVADEGVKLDTDQLTTYLKKHLASFKVPKQFLFLTEEELEITGSGKVKVDKLKEIASAKR